MTRFLASSLGIDSHTWHELRNNLESANGHPVHDIHLSSQISAATQDKLRQLGLDPSDTTSSELYNALQTKYLDDDKKMTRTLQTIAANNVSIEGDVVQGMIHALKNLPDTKRSYSIKMSAMKSLIKQQPPKKTMKKLGYRSLDSMFKHESAIDLLTAACLVEDKSWRTKLVARYKNLKPSDFEARNIVIQSVNFKRWKDIDSEVVAVKKHNVLEFKEMGAVVILPLPKSAPKGVVTASLIVSLHALNDIRVFSSFVKLCQVRAHFGEIVKDAVTNDPTLHTDISGARVSWHLVQRYYSNLFHHFNPEVFEPHLQLEDMAWHSIEESLCAIESNLDFWKNSSFLAKMHDDKAISLNIGDVALNSCNNNSFESRISSYYQKSVWHELLLRYFNYQHLEQSVENELQPELAIGNRG